MAADRKVSDRTDGIFFIEIWYSRFRETPDSMELSPSILA